MFGPVDLSGAWLCLGAYKLGLEISMELTFSPPHAAVLNNFRVFLVMCVTIHFKMLDVAYPFIFWGCVYIYLQQHTWAVPSWSMDMPGREGAGALPQQSSCKATWLPHLNPGAEADLSDWDWWGFPSPPSPRGQALQTLALPDRGVWVTTTHEDPSRKLYLPLFSLLPQLSLAGRLR